MSILLADEEMEELPAVDAYPPTYGCLNDHFREGKKQIAKAQLKKVVEWLEENCTDHGDVSRCFLARGECPDCRQALLKEVE